MSWITANFLMFVCSVAVYLAIRKSALKKLHSQLNNLAMFLVPLGFFLVFDVITRPDLGISIFQAGLMILTGVFLAYLGNASSLKSIELAPNAGYSLIISKSYVILTALLAVPLFNAELPPKALLAILCIVASSALILINPHVKRRAESSSWLPLAIAAFFCWGFLSLSAKYFFTSGMTTMAFLTYLFLVVSPCILFEIFRKNVSLQPVRENVWNFMLIGVAATGFNFFNFQAIRLAPNVGYVNATNAASIAAVTVLSALLFHDEFSTRKVIGVFGVVAGLFLLFLG